MKKIVYSALFILISFNIYSQELTGKIFQYVDAPPWAVSTILFDTSKPEYKIIPLDTINLKVIINYDRFAEDGKGKDYAEFFPIYNDDGSFSIDLQKIQDGTNIAVVGLKEGYLKLWHLIKFCKSCDYTNMKVVFVKARNYKK